MSKTYHINFKTQYLCPFRKNYLILSTVMNNLKSKQLLNHLSPFLSINSICIKLSSQEKYIHIKVISVPSQTSPTVGQLRHLLLNVFHLAFRINLASLLGISYFNGNHFENQQRRSLLIFKSLKSC